MLKEMAASKAAKLIAACVCPVAGTTALTMAVPQVKSAVHRATSPRAKALPRTVSRPVQYATAPVPCYDPTPLGVGMGPLQAANLGGLDMPQLASITPSQAAGGPAVIGSPFVPIGGIVFPGGPGGGGGIVPLVPEPTTWVQLVLGFAVVGGAARATARRRRDAELDAGSERPLA